MGQKRGLFDQMSKGVFFFIKIKIQNENTDKSLPYKESAILNVTKQILEVLQ